MRSARRRRVGATAGVLLGAAALAGCGSSSSRPLRLPAQPRPSAFLGASVFTGQKSNAQVVTVVRGGPAQRAGLRPGDQITAIAGQQVFSPTGLLYILARLRPGETVQVQLTGPEGEAITRMITLGRAPAHLPAASKPYLQAASL
jgi:S1-C subfamily serine protease